MQVSTSTKARYVGIAAGLIGLLAFFLPFFRVTEWDHDGVSGFRIMLSFLDSFLRPKGTGNDFFYGALDEYIQEIYLRIWLAFLAGDSGFLCISIDKGRPLAAGVFNSVAAGALFFLKDMWKSLESFEVILTEIGWQVAFIAFIVAAVSGYVSWHFERVETAKALEERKSKESGQGDIREGR